MTGYGAGKGGGYKVPGHGAGTQTYMNVGLVHHWINKALEASEQIVNHITAHARPLPGHSSLEHLKAL